MKLNYTLLAFLCWLIMPIQFSFGQTIVAQWNFNGSSATSIPGGVDAPLSSICLNSCSAEKVGAISTAFMSGESTASESSDPATVSTDFSWHTTTYAALGTGNRERGVRFNISTEGYRDLVFEFDQRLSNTANNTYAVQYTADRTAATPVWYDAEVLTITPLLDGSGDTWHNQRTVNLSAYTALNNNPNVAIRIVSAFDPETNNYRAAKSTSSYAISGTVRFDMVTLTGTQFLGVNEFTSNQKSFFFYPNPTPGDLIHFNDIVSIQIIDVLGKNVLSANDVMELDISGLSRGVYFIRNENGYTTKLFKN